MVRPIPSEKREAVLTLWLNGKTYREIEETLGVSIATVSNIIKEALAKHSDLDDFRTLNSLVKESGLHPKQAIRGAAIANNLNENELTIEDIKNLHILSKHYQESLQLVIPIALTLKELEETSGKTIKQASAEYQQLLHTRDLLLVEVNNLEEKKQGLLLHLTDHKKLKQLKDDISATEYPYQRIKELVKNQCFLEEKGFTPKTARVFAEELAKIHVTPMKAAQTITGALNEYGGLLNRVLELNRTEIMLKETLANLETKKNVLNLQIEYKQINIQSLESSYNSLKETNDNLTKQNELIEEKIMQLEKDQQAILSQLELANKDFDSFLLKTESVRPIFVVASLLANPLQLISLPDLLRTLIKINIAFSTYLNNHQFQLQKPIPIFQLSTEVTKMLQGELEICGNRTQSN